jgi:hypothetical protein
MSQKETKKEQHEKEATGKDPRNENVQDITTDLERLLEFFLEHEGIGGALTATDRRRLVGSGVRNNGFIDKAFDIARDNPQFMPPHFDVNALVQNMEDLEHLRQLLWTLQQFTQAVSNALLVHSDSCYRDALRIYASLREQARNRVDGAQPLFDALRTFFHRRRFPANEEVTEKQLERDIKALVHGKADGEIIIKNEKPQLGGGLHEVIDHVHKGKTAFKETIEANEEEKN